MQPQESQRACMQPKDALDVSDGPTVLREDACMQPKDACMQPKDVSDGPAVLPVATMPASAEAATASAKATASAAAASGDGVHASAAAASGDGVHGESLPDFEPPETISGQSRWLPDLFELARSARTRLQSGPPPPAFMDSSEFERTFPRDEKIRLGRQVKCMLDYSRAAALQGELGYSVRLVRYTTRSVEDRLLVACRAA